MAHCVCRMRARCGGSPRCSPESPAARSSSPAERLRPLRKPASFNAGETVTTEMQYVDRAERGTLTPPVGERDHVTGPATAAVTLVEYGDFECSYWRKAWTMDKELNRQSGKRHGWVFRTF